MPDPSVSDRERLLRLIDGGPDAVREMQQQRERPLPSLKAEEIKQEPIPPAPLISAKNKIPAIPEAQRVRLAQGVLIAIVVIFAVYSVNNFSKITEGGVAQSPETVAATGGVEGNLRLVGVDWGDTPVALLEDTVTGKTYFVRKNDRVLGVRVGEIQKDRVSVSVNGKNMELR